MINRQKYNLAVLSKLQEFLQKHPDFRFIQALWALDIIDRDENNTILDRFYEEPNITLDKVDKSLAEFKENKKNDIFAENSIEQTAFSTQNRQTVFTRSIRHERKNHRRPAHPVRPHCRKPRIRRRLGRHPRRHPQARLRVSLTETGK